MAESSPSLSSSVSLSFLLAEDERHLTSHLVLPSTSDLIFKDVSLTFLPFSSDSDLRGVGRQVLGGETGEPGRTSCGTRSRPPNPPSRSQSVAGGSWAQREGEEEGIWSSSEEAFSREVIDKVVIL